MLLPSSIFVPKHAQKEAIIPDRALWQDLVAQEENATLQQKSSEWRFSFSAAASPWSKRTEKISADTTAQSSGFLGTALLVAEY